MEALFSGFSLVFQWLIDSTKDISILICFVFIIRYIIAKRFPAWWNYSLWLLLMTRMIIPWEFENRLIDKSALGSMLFDLKNVMSGLTADTSLFWRGWNMPIDRMIIFIWITGAVVLGIYILTKNIRFWLIIKDSFPTTNDMTIEFLEECKDRLDIHKAIDIIITDRVKSPALFGYFHPRLLLPEGILEKLNHKELNYVFMHELGHMKRHDIAVAWLMTVFLIIHWFNPLVWFAFYQMRVDQESACDASVLAKLKHHQTMEYANAIVVFLERSCRNRQLPSMAGILENKTQMKRRLTMIMNYKKYSKTMTVMAVALLLTAGLIFFTLTGFAQNTQIQTMNINNTGNNYVLSELDTPPQVLRAVPPQYPVEAKMGNIEGRVVLRFVVTKEGVVREPEVIESDPAGVFDQAALDAIEQYIFKPGTKDGEPVNCIVHVPMAFQLQ